MGKGLPVTARKSNARMPYGMPSKEPKKAPRDWKKKQQTYTAAGLRRLGAPWVRLTKSLGSTPRGKHVFTVAHPSSGGRFLPSQQI